MLFFGFRVDGFGFMVFGVTLEWMSFRVHGRLTTMCFCLPSKILRSTPNKLNGVHVGDYRVRDVCHLVDGLMM